MVIQWRYWISNNSKIPCKWFDGLKFMVKWPITRAKFQHLIPSQGFLFKENSNRKLNWILCLFSIQQKATNYLNARKLTANTNTHTKSSLHKHKSSGSFKPWKVYLNALIISTGYIFSFIMPFNNRKMRSSSHLHTYIFWNHKQL